MSLISANDPKTKGVAAIEAMLVDRYEAIVSVRGKDWFVVMDIANYHYLCECELEAALRQSHSDLAAGRFMQEAPKLHLERLNKMVWVISLYLLISITVAHCVGWNVTQIYGSKTLKLCNYSKLIPFTRRYVFMLWVENCKGYIRFQLISLTGLPLNC